MPYLQNICDKQPSHLQNNFDSPLLNLSRKSVECTACIASEGLVGKGRVLDLSVPGCLLGTGLQLKIGQSLRLKVMFSGGQQFGVSLAVVRWVNGRRAGIEFIRMSEEDQARLRWHVGYVETRRRSVAAWSEPVMWIGVARA